MKRGHLLILLYGSSTLMFAQFFQRYLLNTGFDEHNIGLVVAGSFAIDILISVPTGILADALGVKKISILGLMILALASVFACITTNWYMLIIGYALYKIADCTVSGVLNLWSKNIPGTNSGGSSGFIFTRLDQMQRIGMVCMAIIVGFAAQKVGFNSSLPWIISLLSIFALMFVASQTACTSKASHNRSVVSVFKSLLSSIRNNSTLQIATFAVFVLGITEGMMNAKYWTWIVQLGFGSPMAIALIVAFLSISRFTGQEFFIRVIKNERSRFLFSLVGISVVTFIISFDMAPIILTCLWFVRVFCYASYFPLLNKELESLSNHDTVSSLLSATPTLNAIGAIIGSLCVAGFKMESQSTFIAMGTFSLLSAVFWKMAFSRRDSALDQIAEVK